MENDGQNYVAWIFKERVYRIVSVAFLVIERPRPGILAISPLGSAPGSQTTTARDAPAPKIFHYNGDDGTLRKTLNALPSCFVVPFVVKTAPSQTTPTLVSTLTWTTPPPAPPKAG